MKPCLSSSGCETRPAKGEPARPVASLAPGTVTDSAKRRHANAWAVGYAASKEDTFPGAQGFGNPEGNSDYTENGRGVVAPGGVVDHGTHEEDGPGTWETLVSPRDRAGSWGAGVEMSPASYRSAGAAVRRRRTSPPHRGRPFARDDRSGGWRSGSRGPRGRRRRPGSRGPRSPGTRSTRACARASAPWAGDGRGPRRGSARAPPRSGTSARGRR